MDTQRLILFAAFMLVSMSLWQSWQIQVNPPPSRTQSEAASHSANNASTQPNLPTGNDLPSVPMSNTTDNASSVQMGTPSVAQKWPVVSDLE